MASPPVIAKPEPLAKGVWRIPLPSRTLPPFEHTNSYLVQAGRGSVLIDLGTDNSGALAALETHLHDLGVTELRALLLTHTHPDHCAGAVWLRERFGIPVYAHPLEPAPFPCNPLEDNATLFGIHAHYTPGHSLGHLSFSFADVLLVGDLLAARGSTWVGLPGGNVTDYLASLERVEELLTTRTIGILGPGHGPAITDPEGRLHEVRAHRLAREAQVLNALEQPRTLAELIEAIYPGLPAAARQAADGSLLALLEKLVREGRVVEIEGSPLGQNEVTWISR